MFALALSLSSLAGPASSHFQLLRQSTPRVHATLQSDQLWYPAGPAMNTLLDTIVGDQNTEFSNIQSGTIDFADAPLPPLLRPTFTQSPSLLITQQKFLGITGIEFNLANNLWGCNFNFGNSLCGIDIRQGIAHLIDKALFVTNEADIAANGVAIDNPLSSSSALLTPTPCGWDQTFPEAGSGCIVGAPGGTSYSPDFCAGAQDIATGVSLTLSGLPPGEKVILANPPGGTFPSGSPSNWTFSSSTDCHLVLCCGAQPSNNVLDASYKIGGHPVNFYIRDDSPPLKTLGENFAEEICGLWSGSFSISESFPSTGVGCNSVPVPGWPSNPMDILDVHYGNAHAFQGYFTSTGSSPTTSWGMFTEGSGSYVPINPFDGSQRQRLGQLCKLISCDPFDTDLYFVYNSQFVSGITSIQPPNGTCSSSAVPNNAAADYVYLCNVSFDSLSNRMEFAPCLTAAGDPVAGATSNGPGGNCSGTTKLSAVSAGIQAEDAFGQGAYSIPVYSTGVQYGFQNGWSRVINSGGTFNYFNWLNAWNPTSTGTLRQGFSSSTSSVDPYIASTPWDFAVVGSVYDSLIASDPYGEQLIDWMALSALQLTTSSLTYTPPAGTTATYRFTLRSDMFFQDGRRVSSFDVAFSYLSLLSTGSILGGVLAPLAGITILGLSQFDINVKAFGPFTLESIGSPPILPGILWTNRSDLWNNGFNACTALGNSCYPAQYTLSGSTVNCALSCVFPNLAMQVDPAKTTATFDPILQSNHNFVGSGPWQCGTVTLTGSTSCTTYGTMNPPPSSSYTLSRFGKGLAPGSSVAGSYFRSNGNLALWIWSQNNGDISHDFLTFSVVASCFGQPVTSSGPCAHFQQGIGANGGPSPVSTIQIAIVNRFVGLNWIAPFNWAVTPPGGIATLPPVLYEGSTVLKPASVAGCTPEYPSGGYDC